MAGGEGTRLRPLTSNQPKPMVPICGKPCIEHIVELLRAHERRPTSWSRSPSCRRSSAATWATARRSAFSLEYSVEESPLGTAGSVKNAAGAARRDVRRDLGRRALRHRPRRGSWPSTASAAALATLALKSVDNPLEFGVVISDEDGRIERFLEKPSWGQVFSDTINTGIYVIEPEVLRCIPEGEPFDFSKQLFPLLLEAGKPLYGYVLPEGEYWQDIGTLDQYRQANEDVLDGRCRVDVPGHPPEGEHLARRRRRAARAWT